MSNRLLRYCEKTHKFVAVQDCQHDWHIWPETDGLEQKCSKCGKYRNTPIEDQFWLKKVKSVPRKLTFEQWWDSNGYANTDDVEGLCAKAWKAAQENK